MTDNINVFFTTSKLMLKKLILNENKTFIIGKVQDKFDKLNYINTKWEIDKKTKICKCVLDDSDYDFSIDGVYIAGLYTDDAKPIKNFYTFDKNSWHCRLYKWIFGKEPHKVHPTMCPYFWIMVLTINPIVFPFVLLIKLFGKTGTKFMEKCSTYKERRRVLRVEREEKRRLAWIENISSNYQNLTGPEIKKLRETSEWDKWKRYLGRISGEAYRTIEDEIGSKLYSWIEEQRILRVEREQAAELINSEKRRIAFEKQFQKDLLRGKKKKKLKQYKESKTSRIIGIGIIVIVSVGLLWLLMLGLYKMVSAINWIWVSYVLLFIVGSLCACALCYLSVVYLLMPFNTYILIPFRDIIWKKIIVPFFTAFYKNVLVPFYKYVLVPLVTWSVVKPINFTVVRPTKYCGNSIANINIDSEKLDNVLSAVSHFFTVAGFVIKWPFVTFYKGLIYAIDFFKMCKDLIYQMYKKNCPVITWVDKEEEK